MKYESNMYLLEKNRKYRKIKNKEIKAIQKPLARDIWHISFCFSYVCICEI